MDGGKVEPGSGSLPYSRAEDQEAPQEPAYSPRPQPGLSEAGPSERRPIEQFRTSHLEAVQPQMQENPLPEQCPDWFKKHKTVFDSLQFFLREGFDTEQKKVDFLTGYKGTYNRVVYSLMEVEDAHQKQIYKPEQFASIHSWLETSLAECPLHWSDIEQNLNHLDQSWRPSGKGRDHFAEDNEGRELQEQTQCFYPEWMQHESNDLRVDQAVLRYWNVRNEGVRGSARKVKTFVQLYHQDRELYEWLTKLKEATESSQTEQQRLKMKAIGALLAESDDSVLAVRHLSDQQKFHWNTLPSLEYMEEHHFLDLDSESESSGDEALSPPDKKPKIEAVYGLPDVAFAKDGRIEINREVLRALGRGSEINSSGEGGTGPMLLTLKELGRVVAQDLEKFSRQFADRQDFWDRQNAPIQCRSLLILFGQLEQFCQQSQVMNSPQLGDCNALCSVKDSFEHFTESLDSEEHSRASTSLKQQIKSIKSELIRLKVKEEPSL